MKYDLVIPCAPKDYVKLETCIERCRKYLRPAPTNVYVVAKNVVRIKDVKFIQEESVFEFGPKDINYRRPNWIYQQIVKLCQDFTVNDYYLCVDADLFFNRPINVFENEKPVYYTTFPQHHEPYFHFMREALNLEKYVDHSFIADFTMFNKKICREIVGGARSFAHKINACINDDCLVGEPEIYGNYLAKAYPDSYIVKKLNAKMEGKFLPELYSNDEIKQKLDNLEEDVDLLVLHSWT